MQEFNKSIRGKLFAYFQSKLRTKKSSNNWYRSDCIFCGGHQSMGINIEQFKAHCFKCGEKHTPITLLMSMESFETKAQAHGFLKIQQEYEAYDRMAIGTEKRVVREINLPESYTSIISGDSVRAKAARAYMKSRKFDLNKLALDGVGYCTKGEYEGYIIFPFYRKGKLVFFQGRKFMGGGPKMKNPEVADFGIGKTQLIFNEDALFMYSKVYITESVTNSLTMGDMGSGLLGKSCSSYQLNKLVLAPFTSAVIILDPDALKEAYMLAMQLVQFKKVKVVELPKEKDVNDIGKKATIKIIKDTPYENYQYFNSKRLNIK